MKTNHTLPRTFRLAFLAVSILLAAMFFCKLFSAGLFGYDVVKISFLDLTRGLEIVTGSYSGGDKFYLAFLILPLLSAVLSVPLFRWAMALAILPWFVHTSVFLALNTDYMAYTVAGRLYGFLLAAQLVLYILWAVFAVIAKKKQRGEKKRVRLAETKTEETRTCPRCSAKIQANARFCTKCGERLVP